MKNVCMAAAGLAMLAGVANAQTIYAMNNLAGGGTGPNTLVSFTPGNPAGFTTIGSAGVNGGFTGLDFDGFTGDLYGWVGFGPAGFVPGLHRINLTTGAATRVNPNAGIANLQDMAWDPVARRMVGIVSSSSVAAQLVEINLATGGTSLIGNITGLPSGNIDVGLAYDAQGRVYVHDVASDFIYRGTGTSVSAFIDLPNDTNFSQGMTIDWSGNNAGYHASIGNTPAFFSRLYTFNTAGAYSLVGNFTPVGTFPTFEGGDLAIRPIPAPASLALAGLAGLAAARRRRA